MERALAVFLATQLAGCSFVAMHSVPPVEGCSESNRLPLADLTTAVVLGGLGTTVLIINEVQPEGQRSAPASFGSIASIALGIVFGLSSWWGYRNIERCRMAHGGPMVVDPP
jgi:hypothetical protein